MSGRLDLPDPIRDEDIDPVADFKALELAVCAGVAGAIEVVANLKRGLPEDEYKRAMRDLAARGFKGTTLYLRRVDVYRQAAFDGWPA